MSTQVSVARHRPPAQSVTSQRLTAWSEAIEQFMRAQLEAGLAPATVEVQARRLRSLAASIDTAPWQTERATLEHYLDTHNGTQKTIKATRQTMRAFYRWAVRANLMSVSPAPVPPPVTRYTLEQRWQDALNAFEATQASDGIAASTLQNRIKHVQRLAVSAECSPWQLSADELTAWLSTLEAHSATQAAHRLSVRAFYRWAVRAGHIDADPTEILFGRARTLEVPAAWQPELAAYRRHLRAGGRAESTTRQHLSTLGRFARAHPSLNPFEVTLDDLLEYTGGKRWAAETRRLNRSVLRSFYKWAEDTGRVDANPAHALPVVRAGQPRPNPAREPEYRAALEAAPARERLALRLAAELGMRCAEVAVSHSRDMEQVGEHWVLVVHGKGDKQRRLPLTADLASTLRAQPQGYFFPGNDHGHISPHYLSKRVSELLPRGVAMHALRHRFATRAYSVDRDVFTVQQLLGHASPATTQRYVLVQDDAMRRLVESVSTGFNR